MDAMYALHCYKQKAPIFDPKNSKTYAEVLRNSSQCKFVTGTSSPPDTDGVCNYTVSYGDRSYSKNGSGMIGLGRGPVSLISQMSSSIYGKFSSCLVHTFSGFNSSSTMSFGIEAVVSGTTAVSTPLLSGGSKSL
ncbi:hypothetical protein ACFX13_028612 [Malus domestica]